MNPVVNFQGASSGFGDPTTLTLSFTPTPGNTLLLTAGANGSQDQITCEDNLGSSFIEDVADGTVSNKIWRLEDIPAGITSITIALDSTGLCEMHVLEVAGLVPNSKRAVREYAVTPEGNSVDHSARFESESERTFVFGFIRAPASRIPYGTDGSFALSYSDQQRHAIYKVVEKASGGTVNWIWTAESGGSQDANAMLVGYELALLPKPRPQVVLPIRGRAYN